jgi:hypothetical protein
MRTALSRYRVEWNVTETVALLSVKVLYGKGMDEKSIISVHTAQVVWHGLVLVSCLVQRTGVGNLSVLKF